MFRPSAALSGPLALYLLGAIGPQFNINCDYDLRLAVACLLAIVIIHYVQLLCAPACVLQVGLSTASLRVHVRSKHPEHVAALDMT